MAPAKGVRGKEKPTEEARDTKSRFINELKPLHESIDLDNFVDDYINNYYLKALLL